MIRQLQLRRLSICPCGFPLLDERIGLGALYSVDVDSARGGFSYLCGGCGGALSDVTVVQARSILNPNAPLRPLPYDVFMPQQPY